MSDVARAKERLREEVWERLESRRAAAFPFPPRGRIPNFRGAAEAARRLAGSPLWQAARVVKVNPDAPQQPVRERAVREGKVLLMPTPRLRGGFMLLEPGAVPPGREREATSIRHFLAYGRVVRLAELPPVDLIVCGSVAVDAHGHRVGKGEGYSDREFALLRELRGGPIPVATTVHELQLVASVPREPFDLLVDLVATPSRLLETEPDGAQPAGIDWSRVSEAELEAMPILRELRELLERRGRSSR
ncbi:MAG: 5-formyltetrahydrofolate cyclo-ligase [Bacillota bacterium]|nr:5-formyltetrahydrofolate cyclo-ligase [Bacillota bacterium]